MANFNLSNVPNVENSIINRTFEMLSEIDNVNGVYGCDLHHYLFNQDYAFIHTSDARKACNELDVFECMQLVNSYEKWHFGEFYTECEPCKIANMVVYILGEEVLSKSDHLNDCWDKKLTDEDISKIIEDLNLHFESWGCSDLFDMAIRNYQ